MALYLHAAAEGWFKYGGGRPRSPLYSIWNVEQLSVNCKAPSVFLAGNCRHRRVVFDPADGMFVQSMDEPFSSFRARIDTRGQKLVLTEDGKQEWEGEFTCQRLSPNQLIVDGEMDDHRLHIQLQLVNPDDFPLVRRGFQWLQEYPFGR
jgi:hypothetical protein